MSGAAEPGKHYDVIVSDDPIERAARDVVRVTCDAKLLSQRNIEAVLGLDPERYLRELKAFGRDHRVLSCGHLRLVDAAEFSAWLFARARIRARVRGVDDPDVERVLRAAGSR